MFFSNPKYFLKTNDNKDMKKFNLNILTPLLLTLMLQGCMPDSLTKFKKDPPKKTTAAATTTTTTAPAVVDSTGNTITFIPPTMFYYSNSATNTYHATVGKDIGADLLPVYDGSFGDSFVKDLFSKRCDLDLTGNAQTQALPSGLNLEATTCQIAGKPLAIATVATAFCSNPNYTSKTTCEAAPLTWNSTTSMCSNPDYQYTNQIACTTAKNKWYQVGSPIPYRIILSSPYLSKAVYTTVNIGAYQAPTGLAYNQTDSLVLKLDKLSGLTTNTEMANYVRSGLLTSSNGVTGVIKIIETSNNTVGVKRLVPLTLASATGFVANDFIYSSGGASGKIQKVSGNTVYVERLYAANTFASGETVGHSASYPLVWGDPLILGATTISSIDTAYVFDMSTNGLDNDEQYFTTKYNYSLISRVYQRGTPVSNIVPFTTTQINVLNGISFSISPALPPGLLFDTATGIISGQFNNLVDSLGFVITASNPVGSVTFPISLTAIDAPKNLSYTTRELISVASNAAFNEGEYLFQPITPPLTESTTGQVLRKYGTTLMSISTANGTFLENAVIDSGNAFYSKKATVLANPIFYNVAVVVSNSVGANVNDYASTNTNALGRVVAKDAVTNTLFIQYLNNSAVPNLFKEGNFISFSPTSTAYVASAVTITEVEADNMKLSVPALPPGIKAGDDLTAGPVVGDLGGYVHKIVGTDLYVSDITRRATQPQYFRTNQVIDNKESMVANNGTISAVAHDNFFIAERGSKVEIKSNVSQGSGIYYSIYPALPAGLTLNTVTGAISGAASFASARTTYTIAAENLVDESKFSFELEVRDYFKVAQNTSAAPSIIMHKYGDNRESRKCRINSTDIKNFVADPASVNSSALDVRCFIDAEEQDLYFNKLKLASSSGAGACEYIQIYPYSFWQFSPITSSAANLPASSKPYIYKTGCQSTQTPTSAALCLGNYETVGGPNCDEGSVNIQEETYAIDSGTGLCTLSTTTTSILSCAGKKTNCLQGPVRDVLTDAQIKAGWRSLLYSSSAGTTVNSSFSAPFDSLDLTNIRAANGTVNNKCLSTNNDADAWASYMNGKSATDNPFGNGANPYYIVNCLNAAKDIKARIRIVVRDWNKTFKISDNIDTNFLPATLPSGATLMNNVDVVFGKSNNDYYDWDDAYNGLAADPQTNGAAKTCGTLGAGGEWGTCSDGVSTTEAACIAAPAVWTSSKYKYPESGI